MTLIIGIGNPLRRDDGVAERVLELLGPVPRARTLVCHQLLPELAEDVAAADRVIFVDADLEPGAPRLEPLETAAAPVSLVGHSLSPAQLLALASALYGFQGTAWLCRVPGVDFGDGAGLSPVAEANARQAVVLLRGFIASGADEE